MAGTHEGSQRPPTSDTLVGLVLRALRISTPLRLVLLLSWAMGCGLGAVCHAEESCLDPADPLGEAGARKGVQKLPVTKRLRAELTVWGGFFASDLLSSTGTYGGALAFYPVEDWGFEASVNIQRFDLGIEKPLTQFFAGRVFKPSMAYTVVGNAVWSPFHFKVKATEHSITYGDLMLYVGAGDTLNDTVQGATFDGGVAIKIYPSRYVGVRFDLRDYVMVQEAVAVQRVTNNIVGTFGIFVMFPNQRPYSK
jgi:outer membrane beta-barrel protein